MNWIEISALFVLSCIATYLIFDLTLTRWGKEMRKEFEQEFPDQCAYCSLIWYGITHGQESPDARPKPHKCIEGMSRWAASPAEKAEKK